MRIAVADVGGTHARFALAEVADGRVVSLDEPVTLGTADHESFEQAWAEFGRRIGDRLPDKLSMAFAGPVGGDVLALTNNVWAVRRAQLASQLGLSRIEIVNDFGAVAHAVAQLKPDDFAHLCGPEGPMPPTGITTIIGPGTGLGVAQLLRTADDYHVVETEGGHVDFAPLDGLEDKILDHLRRRFGRVSVERVASGPGLVNLYRALAVMEGRKEPQVDEKGIWTAALEASDPLAIAALDRFFLALGAIAGDLALAHGASAVVIAGGLGYRLRERFGASGFADRFIAKGRFEQRMEQVPVKLLNFPQPGLYGAAAAFAKEVT